MIFGVFLLIAVSTPVLGDDTLFAHFAGTPFSGVAPLTVSFIDLSNVDPSYGYEWNFGDGTALCYDPSPIHTYYEPKSDGYLVTLNRTSASGPPVERAEQRIEVYPVEPRFTWVTDQDYVPMKISFIDQTLMTPAVASDLNRLRYEWTFEVENHSEIKNCMIRDVSDKTNYATCDERKLVITNENNELNRNPVIEFVSDVPDYVEIHTKHPSITVTLNIFDKEDKDNVVPFSTTHEVAIGTLPRLFPIAGFTYALSDSLGNVVFIDQTLIDPVIGASGYQWEWDFGDGSQNSTLQNPVHTYEESDTYTVTQCAWFVENPTTPAQPERIRGNCDIKSVNVFVEGPRAALSAIIAYDGTIPTLYMSDLSQPGSAPLDTWEWTLTKDEDSTNLVPECSGSVQLCTFPLKEGGEYKYGVYNATVKVTDASGRSSNAPIETVEYWDITPVVQTVVEFTAAPLVGPAPLTVSFTDLSVGNITEWKWNFGDDSPPKREQHPFHIYTKPGLYTVTLEVRDGHGNWTDSGKSQLIFVSESSGLTPLVDFEYTVSGSTATFTDKSVSFGNPIESWNWNFGDGKEPTDENKKQNPEYTYTEDGIYSVTLTATSQHGSGSHTEIIIIGSPDPDDGSLKIKYTSSENKFTFTAYHGPGAYDTYYWYFSDGTPPVGPIQVKILEHEFKGSGGYTVELTAVNSHSSRMNTIFDSVTVGDTS